MDHHGHEQDPDSALDQPSNAYARESGEPSILKRPRVSEACGNCRSRKTKCDGLKPVCRACDQRGAGATCNYDYVRRKRPRQATDDNDSSTGRPYGNLHARSQGSSYAVPTAGNGYASGPYFTDDRPVHRTTIRPAPVMRRLSQLPSGPGKAAPYYGDGTAAIAANNKDASSYGPSSTVAFLLSIMPPRGVSTSSDAQSNSKQSRFDQVPSGEELQASLPNRRDADDFLACYWEFMHPLFPILHKPTFERRYLKFWDEDGGIFPARDHDYDLEDVLFASNLYLTFAIGCMFSRVVEPERKSVLAYEFYRCSRQLHDLDVLDATSISVVQMIMLRAIYLQSTPRANQCWNCVGLALRVAQSLGLHADAGNDRALSQLDREMRRRIWHACSVLDRVIALSFGRPPMAIVSSVQIPLVIDDEYLEEKGEGVQPAGVPCKIGCFVQTCHLLVILQEIIDLFNPGENVQNLTGPAGMTPITSESIGRVVDINRRLDQFSEALPYYLRPGDRSPAAQVEHVQLQQQVLQCRFLLIRLTLLRPLLLTATKQDLDPPIDPYNEPGQISLDSEIILICCELCKRTAHALIGTVYEHLLTPYRSSAWHTVYFVFSGAIALLASSRVKRLRFDKNKFDQSWSKCLYVLRHYEGVIKSAGHAVKILEMAKAQILDEPVNSAAPLPNFQPPPAQTPSAPDSSVPTPGGPIAPQIQPDLGGTFNKDPFEDDILGMSNLSDSWYSHQLLDLDWFDLQPVLMGNMGNIGSMGNVDNLSGVGNLDSTASFMPQAQQV